MDRLVMADAQQISTKRLYDAGIVDELVKEPLGGTYTDQQRTAEALKAALL